MVATSATIIPAPSSHQHPTLSIPVQTQQKPSEPPADSMSLIVQLGTTSVGYTPTFNTSVGTVAVSNHAATSAASRMVNTNQIQVAKHRLPMTINRQPQQHTLPVRNIAALARPIQQTTVMASNTSATQVQNQSVTPVVAGRVLASPVKDTSLDDDLLEGVVEKRPKYHKHLPLNYQYVLQDHNYGAPPPPTPPAISSPSKSPINGMPASNGISTNHSHSHPHTLSLNHSHVIGRSPPTHPQPNSYSSSVLYNNSRQVTNVSSVANDLESDVSSDGEREVEPEGEETETAPEGEGDVDDEDSVTRCICDFQHDDGYMICCDRCSVWQHVDCMGIDRGNIPDEYLCEKCQPRRVEKQRAIALQIRKRRELFDTSDSCSETSSSSDNPAAIKPAMRKRAVVVRRRSEPVRKPSITSTAKPRRESAKELTNQSSARQNNRQTNRKRHVEKRPPARRKNSSLSNNSLHNSNSSSNTEKKNSAQSASSVVSSTSSSSSSSSLSSSSTSSLTSDKINHLDKNLTSPNSSASSGDSVQQLRQWIDSYEEAVTNHYSPELRARIGNIKVNGVHSDLRLPSNLLATPKCRISLLPSGIKILMTCANVAVNQPIIELRGKYMLCGNNGPGLTNRPPRPAAPPPPGPHIFHYKLPRDNTEVCVDCRTYGNDARFVRRSCQPNAEIRHCIEKGTLHLYLVTTSPVDKNTEVTIAYTPTCGIPCICGEKDCFIKKEKDLIVTRDSPPPRNQEKKNGILKATNNVAPSSNSQSTVEKRRRGRRRTASENQPEEKNRVSEKSNPVKQTSTSINSKPAEKTPTPASPPSPPLLPPLTRSASSGSRPNKTTTSSTAVTSNSHATRNTSPTVNNNKKEESTKSSSNNSTSNVANNNSNNSINNNNNNNNIIITNNNNNNNNNSKTSNNNNNHNNNNSNHNNNNNTSNVKSSSNSSINNKDDADDDDDEEVNNKKNITDNSNSVSESDKKEAADKKKKMTREERKLEAIMKAFERMEKDQAKRQTLHRQAQQRKDSTDAEKEKQLAVIEAKTNNNKEKEREEQSASNKNNSIRKRRRKGRGRSHPTHQPVSRARARRAVRRSRNSSTNSRTLSANNQDDSDSGHSTDNEMDEDSQSPKKQSTTSNVSQAADLLMSLSTQNNFADEKENEEDGALYTRSSSYQNDTNSKDLIDDHTEEDDDDDAMQRLNTSTSSSDTPPTPLSKTCLVVAAAVGSLAPGFKFPKTKKGLLNTWFKAPDPGSPPSVPAPDDCPTRPGPGKKRWLRQAISEECESPNRPEMSVSPTDYVAPLKKRRLARESISSEQSFTPPATPVEPVSQLNFDDDEEESLGPISEKRIEYDENDGGCSSAESDVDSPAGPRTPVGPEPRSEADSVKDEKPLEADEIIHQIRDKITSVQDKDEIKNKIVEKEEIDKKEKKNNVPARKKVLSISEYRQRKMQGGRESHDGEIDGEEGEGPEGGGSGHNMVTSSPRSHSSESSSMSSSDEEENHTNAMAKSLLLDVNAGPKPGAGTSRFSCAPTLVERQRENLTERLKREFGLFLSDDEENMAARRQSLNNDIQLQPVQLSTVVTTPGTSVSTIPEKKESAANLNEKEKRKKPPPPPPPLPVPGPLPTGYPMYPGFMPPVRGPAVYPQPYGIPPPLPPPALEPVNVGSAAPYYGPPNSYYGQLPHSH